MFFTGIFHYSNYAVLVLELYHHHGKDNLALERGMIVLRILTVPFILILMPKEVNKKD